MSDILNFYQQQATTGQSTIPWLAELQAKGLQALATIGFPTRHDEDWKYTVVDSLLQQHFVPQKSQKITEKVPRSNLPATLQVTLQNGYISGIDELARQLPAGVIVQPLAQAIEQHDDKIRAYLGKILHHTHGFQALNTAMLQCGVFIYLPEDVFIEEPIVLSHWQDEPNQAIYSRHLIIAEAGSRAAIVEEYRGAEHCSYFTNTITEIFAATRATLVHYKIQCEGKNAYHMGHLAIKQAAGSQFNSHSLSLGGQLVRSDLDLALEEEGAGCLMNGIYAPTEGQHIDHHTRVQHLVPNCQSEQNYKGILTGRSRAVFNGKVFVAKDAQHTKAQQQNKNLLLSSQAEIDTKPQLEIFADDVICTHGATVGQLDEEALFYLAARGISKVEANRYLIQAFAAENLGLVPHQRLAEWMATLLNKQLR
ncbi:Fe-S cluster assembly protein SufD [Legionella fairfieldensis]|uniref:Fe-S cluster assembly protein SufD n=1 Tax=Legionella fairfieldensis TaxID=45064 RepID=UPI0004920A54|nr:Fe-S cluster assembly protein SufD [Legionella fairfieldensis]